MYGYVDGSERIPSAEYAPLFTWSCDLFYGDAGEVFAMMFNEATGFPVMIALSDLFSFTSKCILEEIRRAFLAQGYDNEAVDAYLKEGEAVRFTQKSDQKSKKKLEFLIDSAFKLGLGQVDLQLPRLETTQNRKKVISAELMRNALGQPASEITKQLYLAVPLKVSLRLTPDYSVWRSFLVSPTTTMAELHRILQIGFYWDDAHLHEFQVGKYICIRPKDDIDESWFSNKEFYNEGTVILQQIAGMGSSFLYIYDFGDYWVHTIKIGKPTFLPEQPTATCTGGKGASPWEDCGGAYGFDEMMGILSDPENEQYQEILDWTGGIEDQEFDQDIINRKLSRVFGKGKN